MLAAAVTRAGGVPIDLGVARDNAEELRRLIARGLSADVLLLSGGVSAGVLDLVPQALADMGVRQVFHKVQFKPGKPLWFGVHEAEGRQRLVFGLPGNPVSSLVCFEMFVRPALGRLAGRDNVGLRSGRGALATEFSHRGDRPTYHPARLIEGDGRVTIDPLPWQGSADLRGLAQANGLVHFPAGDRTHQPGDELEVFWL
jgi:molybdopterin molybdotransferase